MPELFGHLPRPRILIHGFTQDEEIVEHIKKIAPTVRLIDSDDIYNIRQKEWDAVVTKGGTLSLRSHLNIFQIGGDHVGTMKTSSASVSVNADWTTKATHFVLPDDCPSEVRSLSRNDLLPMVQKFSPNEHWSFRSARGGIDTNRDRYPAVTPFLTDADDKVLAGKISGETSEIWWLPNVGCSLTSWVSAAFQSWSMLYPDRFPLTEEWKRREPWLSPEEREIRDRLQKVETDLSEAIAKLANEKARLSVELEEKAAEVDSTVRKLLTTQGDELVDQVEQSLRELGFLVTNADKEISTPGDRREDLRVSDPDLPEWTAIAEVRGYARGAQLNDLLRLGRFTTRYLRETGREPSSTWYIVNQEMAKDPDIRQAPLASNKDEVETFAESGGLVIDTKGIFRTLMMKREGSLSASEARSHIRKSSGYFQVQKNSR
ncbi:hypothetical protein N7925_21650 [Streptomyces sp. CA-278952]|uniref:hypothetical protein n=1 Tax=Streptomyces sp. CA-278952 TaxID=2980556 RepID=UPI00236839DE|nr:hypothetical protein [Streptomyces sp. CA-278952]WDG30746.1 hypothetical protein N7925_21650 [Streptomyces sp. CA-278952]